MVSNLSNINKVNNYLSPQFIEHKKTMTQMLAPEKSPGIKFCRQFQKVGARKFRDAITCSYKIVLCQTCKFYHSWRQLWSHDTVVLLLFTCQKGKFVVLLLVTCQKGKLLCLLWSFLLYWTLCLLWGHFHAENETETSSENNNRKFTYNV
jgi:hypothetical protein